MTLALAALTPFPFLKSLPSFPFPPNGIVFVADTRYSFEGGREPFDHGMKFFALGRDAGCVCAGDLDAAKGAVIALGELFEGTRTRNREYLIRLTKKALGKYDYGRHIEGKSSSYVIAAGFIDEDGVPGLICHGPDAQLSDQPDWGFVIGHPELRQLVEKAIWKQIRRPNSANLRFDAEEWGMRYAAAFHDACIAREVEPSVGGGLQCALLTAEKGLVLRRMSFASIPEGDDPLVFNEVTRRVSIDWRRGKPRQLKQ